MNTFLLLLGLVCFVVRMLLSLSGNPDRLDFVAAGLACWIASVLW